MSVSETMAIIACSIEQIERTHKKPRAIFFSTEDWMLFMQDAESLGYLEPTYDPERRPLKMLGIPVHVHPGWPTRPIAIDEKDYSEWLDTSRRWARPRPMTA